MTPIGYTKSLGYPISQDRVAAFHRLFANNPDADLALKYSLYDDFRGAEGPLAGRLPVVGLPWTVTGAAAPTATAGNGTMKQTAADGVPSYFGADYGTLQQKISFEWLATAGDGVGEIKPPPALAICADPSFLPMLHGEGGPNFFLIRLVDAAENYLNPLFVLNRPNFLMSPDVRYRWELHSNGSKMAAMVAFDPDGQIFGEQFIYDFRTPAFLGPVIFFEVLTSRVNGKQAEAESISDYAWPTIEEVAGIEIPTTSDLTTTIFGGSVTDSETGLIISGDTYGQGAQFNLGAVTAGDKFHVACDLSDLTAVQPEMALLKNGVTEAEKSNFVLMMGNGRVSGVLTATENMEGASVAFVRSNQLTATAGSWKIKNLQVLKNPPENLLY